MRHSRRPITTLSTNDLRSLTEGPDTKQAVSPQASPHVLFPTYTAAELSVLKLDSLSDEALIKKMLEGSGKPHRDSSLSKTTDRQPTLTEARGPVSH